MKWDGDPVPVEECKRRALDFGRGQNRLLPASSFAEAVWPGHRMKAQGAGAAASRILKLLAKEGKAGWSSDGSWWGWWTR